MEPIKARTVGLALIFGLFMTAGINTWVVDFSLSRNVFTGSDFAHYCEATDAVRQGLSSPRSHHRSWIASQVPGAFASAYGIIDGLAITALISTIITIGALFLWGWVLGGPLAAVLSAVSVAAFAPLVVLTRNLTFYPQLAAIISLTAWATAWLIERRSLGHLAWAGALAATAGLMQMQGFFFALPAFLIVCAVALWARSLKTIATRMGVVFLIIGLSGLMGQKAYPDQGYHNSIEAEVFRFVKTLNNPLRTTGSTLPPVESCDYPLQDGFRWDKPHPMRLLQAIGCMNELRQQADERLEQVADSHAVQAYRRHRDPWMKPLGVAFLLAILGLRRRPAALVGLLITTIPYGLYLYYGVVDGTIRRLTLGFLSAPIIVGLAGTSLKHALNRMIGNPWATRTIWASVVVWTLMLFGAIPSPVHPAASWRDVIPTINEVEDSITWEFSSHEGQRLCHHAMQNDAEKGVPLLGRLGSQYARSRHQE